MKKLTKLEAAKLLITMDHVYLTPEGAQQIAEPFGLNLIPQVTKANTGDPKGLTVDGAKRGERVTGYDARDLAYTLAYREGLKPMEKFGRGSGLREAAGALIDHLSK
jgi:hypothetical protein